MRLSSRLLWYRQTLAIRLQGAVAQSRFFAYLKESNWFGSFSDVNDLMEHTWSVNEAMTG